MRGSRDLWRSGWLQGKDRKYFWNILWWQKTRKWSERDGDMSVGTMNQCERAPIGQSWNNLKKNINNGSIRLLSKEPVSIHVFTQRRKNNRINRQKKIWLLSYKKISTHNYRRIGGNRKKSSFEQGRYSWCRQGSGECWNAAGKSLPTNVILYIIFSKIL